VNRTGLALSVQQPWAWLIVNRYKDIENRDWSTKVRGLIGIHAGLKFDRESYQYVRATMPDIPMPNIGDFQLGGIVGRVELVDCVTTSDSRWFTGDFGFVLRNGEPLPFVRCRGMLGFFRPNPVSATVGRS
jgi:hypothetical protein